MSDYRRWKISGGTFFFTIVTHNRKRLFDSDTARQFLRESFYEVTSRHPFAIPAIVLLPDHLHMLMCLPARDAEFSVRIRQIKTLFTKRWAQVEDTKRQRSMSRQSRGEHNVWQRRFYEHMVRDEEDFQRCADYIHVNPLKHGLVRRVIDWPWSSFHRWLTDGHYEAGWGDGEWFGDEFQKYE
ncbi:MAG: transposase [Fuerstiella sp.]